MKAKVLPVLLAAASLTGCYGQTEWANRVGSTSATLNARGTTDDGPAGVYFEYWRTAAPATS